MIERLQWNHIAPCPLLKAAMLLLVAGVLCSGCDKAKGIATVKELCAQDGGQRIFDTTYVPGYLTEQHEHFCDVCIGHLSHRRFEFLDAALNTPGSDPTPSLTFYRYTLGKRGDEQCETWEHYPPAARRLQELGVLDEECIVVTQLSERPQVPSYSHQWITLSVDGVPIRVSQWVLLDSDGQRVLAEIKDYQFTSRLNAMLDMSGKGGNPDAKCMTNPQYSIIPTLPARVLRDPVKQADPSRIDDGSQNPG